MERRLGLVGEGVEGVTRKCEEKGWVFVALRWRWGSNCVEEIGRWELLLPLSTRVKHFLFFLGGIFLLLFLTPRLLYSTVLHFPLALIYILCG